MMSLFGNFFPPQITTFVTDRQIDFSYLKNSEIFNTQQIQYLESQFNGRLPRMVNIKQVHGTDVISVNGDFQQTSTGPVEADGIVTNKLDCGIVVRTADCLSVFLYDPNNSSIGLIHAGWKGTKEGVVQKAIERMMGDFNSKPNELKVGFGPAIRRCCYQVGVEFKDYFPDSIYENDSGLYFDLIKTNAEQLMKMGVEENNIFDCQICTCCDKKYFSYRREGKDTGRMLSLIMLKSK